MSGQIATDNALKCLDCGCQEHETFPIHGAWTTLSLYYFLLLVKNMPLLILQVRYREQGHVTSNKIKIKTVRGIDNVLDNYPTSHANWTQISNWEAKNFGRQNYSVKGRKIRQMDGFYRRKCKDSIFWSYIWVCAMYGCKIPESILELKIKASMHIEKNILDIKLKRHSITQQSSEVWAVFYKILEMVKKYWRSDDFSKALAIEHIDLLFS